MPTPSRAARRMITCSDPRSGMSSATRARSARYPYACSMIFPANSTRPRTAPHATSVSPTQILSRTYRMGTPLRGKVGELSNWSSLLTEYKPQVQASSGAVCSHPNPQETTIHLDPAPSQSVLPFNRSAALEFMECRWACRTPSEYCHSQYPTMGSIPSGIRIGELSIGAFNGRGLAQFPDLDSSSGRAPGRAPPPGQSRAPRSARRRWSGVAHQYSWVRSLRPRWCGANGLKSADRPGPGPLRRRRFPLVAVRADALDVPPVMGAALGERREAADGGLARGRTATAVVRLPQARDWPGPCSGLGVAVPCPHQSHPSGAQPEVAGGQAGGAAPRRLPHRLEPVTRRQPPVGLPGPLVGHAGPVAVDHAPRPPASDPHEVALVPAGLEPAVGEAVTEPVDVDVADTGLPGSPLDHLRDARDAHAALAAQPQLGLVGVRMPGPGPEVPVDGLDGPAPDREEPHAPSLAHDPERLVLEVHVRLAAGGNETQAGQLRQPGAGVDETPDDSGVPALVELDAIARLEERPHVGIGQHRGRSLRDLRRAHTGHRGFADLALFHSPLEERLQALVPGQGRPGLPPAEELLEERLDVLPADRRDVGGHPADN